MNSPWTIHEAEVALYPAWMDGMPFRGPGAPRGVPAPIFFCKSGVSISAAPQKSAPLGHEWTGNQPNADGEWKINLSFIDGALADAFTRVPSRLAPGGFHILVLRFIDERTNQWTCLRFYYTTWETDESSDSAQVMGRAMSLRSTWMQEQTGEVSAPSMSPVPLGEVDWICGSQRITCYTYHPEEESWTSQARNDAGDGTRYVNLSPIFETPSDIALAAYLPRARSADTAPGVLPRYSLEWRNTLLLRIGSHQSTLHHGLTLLGRMAMQTIGIPEPLLSYPQSRAIDEPVVVFRYLRRIYATIGHGVLAVPALYSNEPPPLTHDYAFRLAIPGQANPTTGQSGLTILPDGAWLDGTVTQWQ